ncbi:MAG: HEPN domain-containing protein [Candidatus Omnitrophota bacterium]|nr:HEPN domain-containing protein [Candidatus Omnitrophota bacterium]
MTRDIKTSRVPKPDYINYLKKAEEFLSSAQDSLIKDKWNAAGLNAIHAGISAADALLVALHGIKSTSPKHDDIIKLLSSLMKHKGLEENISHLRSLISMKSIVEYDQRLITQSEAVNLSKHSERFLAWVKNILPKGQ